ncbi:MAG: ATP-dependent DNA helicase RecG [Lachnospiraceae bacterium]|nr:ATP-dependent DNA helicase RecG [Lachnospiraceae bacterium]
MNLDDNVTAVKGIGDKTAESFQKLGIEKIRDLISYFPRDYKSYSEPVPIRETSPGDRVAVFCQIVKNIAVIKGRRYQITTTVVSDGNDAMEVVWFNQPYLRYSLHKGEKLVFYGRVETRGSKKVMQMPETYGILQYQKMLKTMQPIYSLRKGISNHLIRKAIMECRDLMHMVPDPISEDVRDKYHLMTRSEMLLALHFPKSEDELRRAAGRAAFDEFLRFLLQVKAMRDENVQMGTDIKVTDEAITKLRGFVAGLPFKLTAGQGNALKEIFRDMQSGHAMNRLVQGDVGSGKTIVAASALLSVILSGYQGALMAPTEVLAEQHYQDLSKMLKPYKVKVCLLTGAMTAKEKRLVYADLASGACDLVIGTHAIIQDKTVFKNLGLVVTDEQHRFGVRQREKLASKGNHPHTLIMSATPIPRTLAIMLYADLDISVIRELPKGRKKILNSVIDVSFRPAAYQFIREQVKQKHQAYVICPMVEESEAIDAENVIDYSENLQQELGRDIKVEYLHGKMKDADKVAVLNQFSQGQIDVLVSTTVVEVGINNPNATVMMIENAERYGLAQLHQLRGRVGRGQAQSYCMFMNVKKSKQSVERLKVLEESNDGFFIAEQDLKLRGPGEFFGVRQSGDLNFKYADIYTNADMLKAAQEVSLTMSADTEGLTVTI